MALLTSYWGLDGIILFLVAIVAAYLYMTRKFNYWKKRGVTELPPTPFLGSFTDVITFRKSPGQFLRDLYEQYKDVKYLGFYIFDKPVFLIRDHELVKLALIKDFNYFNDRVETVCEDDGLGNANLFLIRNPTWKFLRHKLTPTFTSGKIKKMFQLMENVSKDLEDHFESLDLKGKGRAVEIKEICGRFTTDNIGTVAFGLEVKSLCTQNSAFRDAGRDIVDFTFKRGAELGSFFFAPGLVKPFGFKFFTETSSTFLRKAFWDTIDNRIETGYKRNDLIDILIEMREAQRASDKEESFKLEGDNMVAQATFFFTAGFETTSTTISFAMYELARNPDMQKRLREEIKAARDENNGKLSYEMVMTLPYLGMVVSETLRMYPPLPFLNRVVTADYEIPDSKVVLEKGTPVLIPMYGLHYDPEFFPEPEKFIPERFSEENKQKIPSCAYLPFGEGPHNCIGLRLGLLQAKLGVISMVSKYEVSPCEKTLIPMRYNNKALTIASEGGMYLHFREIPS